MNEPKPQAAPTIQCKHLRCKEMYYGAHGQQDESAFPQVYWCAKTLESYGPDKDGADSEECCEGRTCYER